jgi:release factor glutamine methyltransferase
MKTKPASITLLSIGSWLKESRLLLESRRGMDANEAAIALQVLLANHLGQSRAWVLANPGSILTSGEQDILNDLLLKLVDGMPLPYLTGRQEFFGLDFEVNPDVLIPRPETELLVERALDWIGSHPECQRGADVGTGSGCIAISLAVTAKRPTWLAVDRSWAALQTARRNAARQNVSDRIRFLHSSLMSACTGPFDIACANLPYIPQPDLPGLAVARFEPALALDGGEDGLRLIQVLLASAQTWLAPAGLILLEMQFDQGQAITEMCSRCLPGSRVTILPDLAGLPRIVEIQNL